jgi:hypothetical protein
MKNDVNKQNRGMDVSHHASGTEGGTGSVGRIEGAADGSAVPCVYYLNSSAEASETSLTPVDPSMLR